MPNLATDNKAPSLCDNPAGVQNPLLGGAFPPHVHKPGLCSHQVWNWWGLPWERKKRYTLWHLGQSPWNAAGNLASIILMETCWETEVLRRSILTDTLYKVCELGREVAAAAMDHRAGCEIPFKGEGDLWGGRPQAGLLGFAFCRCSVMGLFFLCMQKIPASLLGKPLQVWWEKLGTLETATLQSKAG